MSKLRPLRNDSIDQEEARVDLAPLIDVVFLLLIFYVVAATFTKPTAVPINRPQATQTSALPQRPLTLTIASDESLWLGDATWSLEDTGRLQEALAQLEHKRVLIHADGAVSTRHLVRVIDTCRSAGAQHVDLAADQQGNGQ